MSLLYFYQIMNYQCTMLCSSKKILFLAVVSFVLVSCGQAIDTNNNASSGSVPTQNIVLSGSVLPETLKIDTPGAGDMISSPVTITGEARGWYFEGSFPISIVDENGATLSQGFATAQDDWMQDAFVPFKAEISFSPGTSKMGAIIFDVHNPSGLENNENRYELPVIFQEQVGEKFTLYYNNSKMDPTTLSCETVYPVERALFSSQDKTRDVFAALLAGPIENETANGYFTSIPKEAELRTITLDNGVLTVDFNAKLNTGGSCQSQSIRAQLENTARSLNIANTVRITVNGSSENVLQP